MVALSMSDGRINMQSWQRKCHHQVFIQISIHLPKWIHQGEYEGKRIHCLVWELFITFQLCCTSFLKPHHMWHHASGFELHMQIAAPYFCHSKPCYTIAKKSSRHQWLLGKMSGQDIHTLIGPQPVFVSK